MWKRHPWREELEIIDSTMRAISGIVDPEELVERYWSGIGKLIAVNHYVSLSRRGETAPNYLLTRSSRFEEDFNPWTQRDRLPRMRGGLLGELIYGNKPMIIDDLPARLKTDDPAHYYLDGFASMVGLPQYDHGEGLNATVMLLPAGMQIDHEMVPMLHWQTALFGRGTQNLVLKNQLAGALKSLDRELQAVGEIQRSLLPAALPTIPGFELSAFYQTSARAGGDYYDFFPLAGGSWGMFIADVSGHGTPAAVLMAITHAIAHAQPGTHTPPKLLLEYLNDRLTRTYTRGGTFVTAFYAVLDPARRTLTYSCAGHNPPRLVRGECVISLDKSGALPLGIEREQAYEQTVIELDRGDLLVLYTDGITEAVSPSKGEAPRDLFGVDRLDRSLLDCGTTAVHGCIKRVRDDVCAFSADAPPTDDQTLIAIRCV